MITHPWNATQDLAHTKNFNRRSKEGDEDECGDERKRNNQDLAITETMRKPTITECAYDGATGGCITQPDLPWTRNLVSDAIVETSVPFLERRLTIERTWTGQKCTQISSKCRAPTNKHNIVALHNDSGRQQHRPHDRFRVTLQSFEQCHGMLVVRGCLGLESRRLLVR